MRRVRVTRIATVSAVAAFLLLQAFSSRAAGDNTCSLKEPLSALTAATRGTFDDEFAQTKSELAARRALLAETIRCALLDLENLETRIRSLEIQDPGVKRIQNDLVARIEQARIYYLVAESRIASAGMTGTRDLARNLLEWRRSTYAPLSAHCENFALWAKNDELLRTAERRLRATRDAAAISAFFSVNNGVIGILEEAATVLGEARTEHAAARRLIEKFEAPGETIAHIKTTLELLSTSYRRFLDLREALEAPSIKRLAS